MQDEVLFQDGTYFVQHIRNGFSNPHADNVGHNMRILRPNGTATTANYGYAGDACNVREWSRWNGYISRGGDFDQRDLTSETLYLLDGTAVRVEMVPDYTKMSMDVNVAGLTAYWGVNLKSATAIRPNGNTVNIPAPADGDDVSFDLGNGMTAHIRDRGFSVELFVRNNE